MTVEDAFKTHQTDLACLDTKCGDHSDYGVCLLFAWTSSAVHAVMQMFETNGALAFETSERETEAECYARWRREDVVANAVAA